jgi:hypothetical protein
MLPENIFEENFVLSNFVGENSKPLFCRLENELLFHYNTTLIMMYGDLLMRRVTEIIDRVVEAGVYMYWISWRKQRLNIQARKIPIVDHFDGYYSINLYYMQPAFYLLLMVCCLSTLYYGRVVVQSCTK